MLGEFDPPDEDLPPDHDGLFYTALALLAVLIVIYLILVYRSLGGP